MTDRLPIVEPDVRDLLDVVRSHVNKAVRDLVRMHMQGSEAAANAYAAACLEELPRRLAPLIEAHDALAAVLNAACPGADPVISLSSLRPA